jgi:hypothetical protein
MDKRDMPMAYQNFELLSKSILPERKMHLNAKS